MIDTTEAFFALQPKHSSRDLPNVATNPCFIMSLEPSVGISETQEAGSSP